MTISGANRRLKILHIDPERNWGGGEAQVLGLINGLAAKGHENELLAHPNGRLFSQCQKLEIVCRPIVIRNDLDWRCIPALRRLIRTGDLRHCPSSYQAGARAGAVAAAFSFSAKIPSDPPDGLSRIE